MKKLLVCLLLALVPISAASCAMPEANSALLEFNDNIEFGGILLGMTLEQMRDALGEPDAENISAGGTEYSYHDLDISALADEAGIIKRISSKNTEFSFFDIAIGDSLSAADDILTGFGYTLDAAGNYRYNKNEVQIILLTIDGNSLLGFTAEWLA